MDIIKQNMNGRGKAVAAVSNTAKGRNPARSGKGIKTPPEVQAQIIASLLSGQFANDSDVAQAAGVSKNTVSRLRKYIPEEFLKQVDQLKTDKLGKLIMEFLEEALESSKRIDNVTVNREWLERQDAASLATFYGVKADKIIRLLELIEAANSPQSTDDIIFV